MVWLFNLAALFSSVFLLILIQMTEVKVEIDSTTETSYTGVKEPLTLCGSNFIHDSFY